jgi:hypothetical protein
MPRRGSVTYALSSIYLFSIYQLDMRCSGNLLCKK